MKSSKIALALILSILCVLLTPFSSKANTDKVVDAINQFTFDAYSLLSKDKGNIFFSPWSITTALAMTYEGARGNTAEEIRKVFHFPKNSKALREGFLELIREINRKDKKYQLHTANALWIERTYKLLDEYISVIDKYYQGKATNVSFAYETEKSRLMINKWVEEQTNDKIKELIKRGMVDRLTKLVITNAIYFKGNWQIQTGGVEI